MISFSGMMGLTPASGRSMSQTLTRAIRRRSLGGAAAASACAASCSNWRRMWSASPGEQAVGADDPRGEQPGPNAVGLAVLQPRSFERTPGETADLRLRRVVAGEITEEGREILVVGPLGVPVGPPPGERLGPRIANLEHHVRLRSPWLGKSGPRSVRSATSRSARRSLPCAHPRRQCPSWPRRSWRRCRTWSSPGRCWRADRRNPRRVIAPGTPDPRFPSGRRPRSGLPRVGALELGLPQVGTLELGFAGRRPGAGRLGGRLPGGWRCRAGHPAVGRSSGRRPAAVRGGGQRPGAGHP